jgi:hypothetical protein
MIAHDKEATNERDVKIVRPDVTGGSYNEIFKLADSVGYMYADGKKRVLDFNPTENYVGKNPAQFDIVEIPNYNTEPRFAATLIADVKSALGNISEESQKIVAAVAEFRGSVGKLEKPDVLTKLIDEVNKLEEPAKSQCKVVLNDRAKSLGFEFDKKSKGFKAKEEPAEAVA